MASIKRNFGYNIILTLCNYLFPLITYPYVSRVLGVENIGICNFVDSIVNYFIIIAQLGIASFGVREIARCKDDKEKRDEVFSNLFFISVITFLSAIVILIICTYSINTLIPYKPFLMIGVLKLLFTLFLIEWFFQGIEKFKYITIRSVLVRLLYVISVFVFVHSKEDVYIYYLLLSLTIVLNAIFNWSYSRRFRKISFAKLTLNKYIVPILVFGYYNILTSMYTTFNVTFLGFVKGDTEVGYFSTATKLYSIILSIISAFTTVMIPRVSNMLEHGKKEELQNMANKIISSLIIVTIPVILLCVSNAPTIILLLSGPGYEGAITPFKIVIFLLLIIGLEQVIIRQFIMASRKTSMTFLLSTVGAIVGVTINILITPLYGAVGSSIAWGVSEVAVLFVGLYLLNKNMGIYLNLTKNIAPIVIGTAVYIIIVTTCMLFIHNNWINMVVSTILILISFLYINLKLFRNELLYNIINSIMRNMKLTK